MVGIAVGVAVLAPELIPLVAQLGVSTAVATAIVGVGLSLAASLAIKALGLTPRARPTSSRDATPIMFRQAITEANILYGRRRVGGLLVFFHARQSGSDHFRYFVIAVAGHRCRGNPAYMLNDEIVTVDGDGKVTSGPYANAAWLWFVRGTADDAAHATFVAECGGKWTANHRGRGVAKLYAKFQMTDEVIQSGMPNMTAVIDGKDDLRDPRTGTAGYSTNATIVTYDWLEMPREEGGYGAWPEEVPDDAWLSAQANVCDENVAVPGGTEKRYTLEGNIITGAPPAQTLTDLVFNQAGAQTYSEGKFLVRPGYYVPVTSTITEDQLKGPLTVSAFDQPDEAANEVHGTFVDQNANFQGAPFPAQIGSAGADSRKQMDLDLAWITSIYRAERIARIVLRRAQADKTVRTVSDISTLAISALDTIQLATSRYGLSNYAFQVRGWSLTSDYNIGMQLREENAEIYADPTSYGTVSVAPAIVKPGMLRTKGEAQEVLRTAYFRTGGPDLLTVSESGGTATITIAGFTLEYRGIGTFEVAGETLTTTASGSPYPRWIYFDDPELDGVVSIGATNTQADALNSDAHPYRRELGFVIVSSTGTGGSGSGAGGGGYGQPPPGTSWP